MAKQQSKICAKLLALRKSKGLSQNEMAEKSGISASSISKWECSTRTPGARMVMELAKFFGVEPGEIYK